MPGIIGRSKKRPGQRVKRSAARRRFARKDPQRVAAIVAGLAELYPDASCELNWKTPFELLVATILSAQCTDKRVNLVTPELFRRYPDAWAMAKANLSDLEKRIRSTGFFRNKARNIRACANALVDLYGGEVPRTMEQLIELPGVARKTANVILGTAFGIAEGVVVDTHIHRLSRRLGLTREDEPKKIEQQLVAIIPRDQWIDFGHRMIWHGRRVCDARRPACGACLLAPHCPSAFLV